MLSEFVKTGYKVESSLIDIISIPFEIKVDASNFYDVFASYTTWSCALIKFVIFFQ